MASSKIEGAVAGLWRFPVKSMRGEQLEEAEMAERGVLGDRAYALIDTDTGKVVSAKSVKLFPNLFDCKAAFVEPPRGGGKLPPVQISLLDGTSVRSDAKAVFCPYVAPDLAEFCASLPFEITADGKFHDAVIQTSFPDIDIPYHDATKPVWPRPPISAKAKMVAEGIVASRALGLTPMITEPLRQARM